MLQQKYACHDNFFVKIMFVTTKLLLWQTFVATGILFLQQKMCFVVTNTCLSWQKYTCCDKTFVATKLRLSWQIFGSVWLSFVATNIFFATKLLLVLTKNCLVMLELFHITACLVMLELFYVRACLVMLDYSISELVWWLLELFHVRACLMMLALFHVRACLVMLEVGFLKLCGLGTLSTHYYYSMSELVWWLLGAGFAKHLKSCHACLMSHFQPFTLQFRLSLLAVLGGHQQQQEWQGGQQGGAISERAVFPGAAVGPRPGAPMDAHLAHPDPPAAVFPPSGLQETG